jgi:large subunit ribosomal protein L40e
LLAFAGGENMGKFPEADARLLNKKICMSCYSKNSVRATRCRRCGYAGMRLKAKESRKK